MMAIASIPIIPSNGKTNVPSGDGSGERVGVGLGVTVGV